MAISNIKPGFPEYAKFYLKALRILLRGIVPTSGKGIVISYFMSLNFMLQENNIAKLRDYYMNLI
jgi:hypothetical protein